MTIGKYIRTGVLIGLTASVIALLSYAGREGKPTRTITRTPKITKYVLEYPARGFPGDRFTAVDSNKDGKINYIIGEEYSGSIGPLTRVFNRGSQRFGELEKAILIEEKGLKY